MVHLLFLRLQYFRAFFEFKLSCGFYQLLYDMTDQAKVQNGDHLTVGLLEGMHGLSSGACRCIFSSLQSPAVYIISGLLIKSA